LDEAEAPEGTGGWKGGETVAGKVIKHARIERRPFSVIPPEVPEDLLDADPVAPGVGLPAEEAGEEAERVLIAARVEAQRILEAARNQARALEEGARRAGREEGLRAGRREASEEVERAVRLLTAMAERVEQERMRLLERIRLLLPDLAVEIARRVIQREVSVDRTFIAGVVEDALHQVSGHERILLYVNPEDLAAVEALRPDWAASCSGSVTVLADPSVDPGGCLVESVEGLVDARVATKLEEIRERLREVIRNGSP
jgi:flagellar assembly protein FliH